MRRRPVSGPAGIAANHNETLVREPGTTKGLKVKTRVRAGLDITTTTRRSWWIRLRRR